MKALIEYSGETYVTATEVAKRFKISWGTYRNNILPRLEACYLPGRRHVFYKLSDVEQLAEVRVEKKPLELERSVSQSVPLVAKLAVRPASS